MYNPVSSYRIQFSRSFTLNDLERNIDYIKALGAGSIYASPVFAAVKGSAHGYDVTSPDRINPEIGTDEQFQRLSKLLQERGTGWIQDIVPNHMAFHHENPWIWDLLEKGTDSVYYRVFDIEQAVAGGKEKLMLPFLGSDPESAIKNHAIKIVLARGSFALKYYDNLWPLNFGSYRHIMKVHMEAAPLQLRDLWSRYDIENVVADSAFLNGGWEKFKKESAELWRSDPMTGSFTEQFASSLNNSPDLAGIITGMQHYEPCHWKDTSKRINYRRFFTVNGLICLRMEDKRVMKKHHRLIRELAEGGCIRGLRIDHVDGLRDPASYLGKLRSLAGGKSWVVVEKILGPGEKLPGNWPVEGTSGYDFLAMVNNLMIRPGDYTRLLRFWHRFTGITGSPDDIVYGSKKLILESHMKGEFDNICRLFEPLLIFAEKRGLADFNEKKGVTKAKMKEAVGEFMIAFPQYRLYPEEYPLCGKTKELASEIFSLALKRNPGLKNALRLLKDMILYDRTGEDEYYRLLRDFLDRLMQYTGPLAAKGVEDTAMYRYNCFIAGNEVGDSLYSRGMSTGKFHEAMISRLSRHPLSMNSTSTHDTKRGEDVRARLNALGELADEWTGLVRIWEKMNRDMKRDAGRPGNAESEKVRALSGKGVAAPSANEEYLIYQTIAGTFPFDEKAGREYVIRITDYLVKALREAKQNSNWEEPDEKYEEAVCHFAESLLNSRHGFLRSFIPFHRKLAWRGVVNSLAQLVLKCCSPGIPDIYRGTEVWDLSLVDPDNRRPADLEILNASLGKIIEKWKQNRSATVSELYHSAHDGRIKLLLTRILLNERNENPGLFLHGDYQPVEAGGKYGTNIMGFIRRHEETWLLCIVPLHSGALSSRNKGEHFSSIKWGNTHITVPEGAPEEWKNVITGEKLYQADTIPADKMIGQFPVAVLRGKRAPFVRKAGILMHISSLPGDYGTGDLGAEAYRFVDFLSLTFQSYWQVLPLSPVTGSQSWSPYSSPSAFAGNTLLVSPRSLYEEGLVSRSDLDLVSFRKSSRVNHEKALRFREMLLKKGWDRLREDTGSLLHGEFEEFCKRESYWLEDYTLFIAYKHRFGKKEWNRWPAGVKNRDEKTLKTGRYELAGIILFEKFKQFLFDRQWKKLKDYANNRGIRIFGDIPFYVSYDSADVWANQHLFNLRDNGKMKTVAGVPPDYFDKNGQLWNMPVYNWERIREKGYDWWIRRLGKNLELFDLLRLDHFRAFSDYWEIPAGEKTAVNGQWRTGPESDFFRVVKDNFPSMPFAAEDLGEIHRNVYDLRDEWGLPGMQVLQFGFDRDMATSIHAPHNHVFNSLVYTGTHDNNTVRGWYGNELDKEGKGRLQKYAGRKIKSSELHWELIRMAMSSPARLAIVPMQDYMGLGREARMNTPSTSRRNWLWKMKNMEIDKTTCARIREFTVTYNRI